METTATLYRTDFYAWTQKQAALLQAEEFENLDLPDFIEELIEVEHETFLQF